MPQTAEKLDLQSRGQARQACQSLHQSDCL